MQRSYFRYNEPNTSNYKSIWGSSFTAAVSCGLPLGCLRVWPCGRTLYDLSLDCVKTWFLAKVKLDRSEEWG